MESGGVHVMAEVAEVEAEHGERKGKRQVHGAAVQPSECSVAQPGDWCCWRLEDGEMEWPG